MGKRWAFSSGARLVACAVYGSVGRGTPREDSDVDLLIVARDLPVGRVARVEEFLPVEARLLDMVEDARLLYDPEGVLRRCLFMAGNALMTLGKKLLGFAAEKSGCCSPSATPPSEKTESEPTAAVSSCCAPKPGAPRAS